MYQIQPSTDPYSRLIATALQQEFPTQSHASPSNLVDVITAEILGTKQQRYGPKPTPEVQVGIRDVIRAYTGLGMPIPFLVPWGSEKPDGGGPDLAEMWGLKMLRCLNGRVRGHYPPGLVFNLRIDDASAPHLFFDRTEQAREDARHYSDLLEMLVLVLEMNPAVETVRESSLMSEERFNDEADTIVPAMEAYLLNPANCNAYAQLVELGWTGLISEETKAFYLAQYFKLHPMDDSPKKYHRLARYLSGSLARKRLGVTGANPGWSNGYLELAFFSSPPGVLYRFPRRVYYRTLPSGVTSNHMSPWRAKGYMLISNENELCPKLASFNEPQEYNQNQVTLVNGDNSVVVRADYIVV